MESSTGESGSPTTSSENATVWSSPPKRTAGRTKFHKTRHPIYRGVGCRGNANRSICKVREPNIRSSVSSVQELKRTVMKVANTFNGVENGRRETDQMLSTSASRVSDDTEVVSGSSIFNDDASDSDRFDQIEFELDMNGEMDLGLYYASLAEALLMEPPVGSYGSCDKDEEEENAEMTLWSYIV